MTNSEPGAARRGVIFGLVIVGGMLMPYISRIPLAFTYGLPWIWIFIDDAGSFLRWNGGQLVSLLFVAIFGMLFIFTKLRWPFYLAVLSHYALTAFLYCDLMATRHSDDFLGFIVAPFFITPASLAAALIGLVVQQFLNRRNTRRLLTVAADEGIA